MQQAKFQIVYAIVVVVVCAMVDYNQASGAAAATAAPEDNKGSVLTIVKRFAAAADDKSDHTAAKSHHSMVHNHMSRKVFDRACAASKDTIDEIIACITDNEAITKTVKPELAQDCHKETFGVEFDPKDIHRHKEMICNNREKFENMTACIYRKLTESLDPKEMDKLAEAMVDVGLCIINALDG